MKSKEGTMTAAKSKPIALMVTTSDRGVFFGYGQKTIEKHIEMTQVRMCISWSADMRGVWGLAVLGPSKTCKYTGERLWIVAMYPPFQFSGDKIGSLKREIICEVPCI